MISFIRCDSSHEGFITLTARLDDDLGERNGQAQKPYQQYNLITNLTTVVLALDDEVPVACGCFKDYQADTVEVKRIYVLPEYRGKGLAKQLLRHLEAWAAELGYRNAVLETGLPQFEAVKLYESSGYQRIENYGPYAAMPNSVCFQKTLRDTEKLLK